MARQNPSHRNPFGLKTVSVLAVGLLQMGSASAQHSVPHDQIAPIAQPSLTEMDPILPKFRPLLWSYGCAPSTAVDASGNYNGGLEPTAYKDRDHGCTRQDLGSVNGQLYARYYDHTESGLCAIMYMWYFPKDASLKSLRDVSNWLDPIVGTRAMKGDGHRHDFESVIVWATSCDADTAELYAVSYSGHGAYNTYLTGDPASNPDVFDGGVGNWYPEVTYAYHGSVADGAVTHRVDSNGEIDDQKNTSPTDMIQWELLPAATINTLETHDWGGANCLMCDKHWDKQLSYAWDGRYDKDHDSQGLKEMA